jgi:murein DD-endopeptidase MepM/ murein hydrolase activator NlpD
MQNHFFIYRTFCLAILIVGANILFASCDSDASNSNVATLYHPSPTPATNAQTLLEDTNSGEPSPSVSPSIVEEAEPSSSVLPIDSPSPSPTTSISSLADDPFANKNTADAVVTSSDALMIPVVGIQREELRDTFKDSRSEGRVHDAIDIMAAHNSQVVAAADGEIARFFDSERGGITVYQFSQDKKLIYYYAHLDRRAKDLREGEFVKQGTLIGYVGNTGNSGVGNYHLHFAIWTVDDPKRYWDGTNINPYPLLKQAKLAAPAE